MKHSPFVFWIVLLSAVVVVTLSGCCPFVEPVPEVAYDESVNFWVVNNGDTFLCPDLALPDSFPPIGVFNIGDTAFPEEGILPVGEQPPAAGEGQPGLPPGDVDPTKLAGPYDVDNVIPEGGDPNQHQMYVEGSGPMPDRLNVEITDSTVSITGPSPWVDVSGTLNADGSFIATGRGMVAGRSDVAVSFTGTLTNSGLDGSYEMGLEGRLPGGSITYNVTGLMALASGTVISKSHDEATGVTTKWIDLDGDGNADVIRTYDANDQFIAEQQLDQGGVVTFGHFDASTGVEWKWVDTDGDGKVDVRRRYDRDGKLIEEQKVDGTATAMHFDSASGVTTLLVDTDGDGVADVERRFNRNGSLIEERAISDQGTGTIISDSHDTATGLTTQWVDLDGDGQPDVVRRRDADGNLVDEKAVDMGHVVTFAHYDASTGVETRYVDSDGDGKPDVVRRYDRDGNLLNERGVTGKLFETDYNDTTGVTTEWIDLDGDGKPDVIRTYDRDGYLIEEEEVKDGDVGKVIGQSVDEATGATTYGIDTDADAQVNVELECDANGAVIAQHDIHTGIMAFLTSLFTATWVPICGGILLFAGIFGGVIVFAGLWEGISDTWEKIKNWWNRPSVEEILENLRQYMLDQNLNDVMEIVKAMIATSRTWEGGGGIALNYRKTFITNCQNALNVATLNKEKIIETFIAELTKLFDGLKALSVFSFGLEVAFSFLSAQGPIPSALGLLKLFATLNNMRKLIKTIEIIEKIDSVKGRIEKMQELLEKWQYYQDIGEQIPQDFGMSEVDTPTTAIAGTGSFIAVVRGLIATPVSTLRGCSPIAVIFGLAGFLGILAILLYALFGGFQGTGGEVPPDVGLEEDTGEIVGEDEVVEVLPTVTPTLSPELRLLTFVLESGEFTEEQKSQIALAWALDPTGDFIYSIAREVILKKFAWLDITSFSVLWLRLTPGWTDMWFNHSYFPCDAEIEGGIVVCTETAEPMPDGNVLMAVMHLDGDVPLEDPDRFYTYAAVFDADGDPANNFQYQPPYDWDYFQGTDRWYSLDWDPNLADWSLTVIDVAQQQWSASSRARAVIHGDVIIFFIPAEEFSAEQPGYRLTAFGHDGTFALAEACGDVTGADPTEPLRTPYEEEILFED